ncbi:SagB/ThcOx family dehydrogenase [Streptomyces sp. NPDC014734]|uniref:SagB/ThcOx family dehydrogenase n=1 Tax=Streptomyces sp. NPDC014734 TaxID=3364886 RepID=UPI003700F956
MSESPLLTLDEIRNALVTTECRSLSVGFESIGLRTHEARFDNLSQTALPRVAEEFLLAGRNRRHDRDTQLSVTHYFTDPVAVALSQLGREATEASRLALPAGSEPEASLTDAVAGRRSVRDFAGLPVSLDDLATVLRYANSETAEIDTVLESGSEVSLRLRTVPSGGGLYPIEIWIGARNISGLAPGIYRYLPHEDSLAMHGGADVLDAATAAVMESGSAELRLGAGFALLVAQPWRAMRKYGPRGMRFVFHEAGGISQNIHLAATALGLGSLDSSSFYDDDMDDALGLDGLFRTTVHLIVLGHVSS